MGGGHSTRISYGVTSLVSSAGGGGYVRRRSGAESALTALCLERARTHTVYAVLGDSRVMLALRS